MGEHQLARPLRLAGERAVAAVAVTTVDGARSVVARAGVAPVAIAAAVIAVIAAADRRPDERRELLDDAAELTRSRGGGRRLCLVLRLRPRLDLLIRQARRSVRLQAREQHTVHRHLTAAATAFVVLLRGGDGGRTGLAVGRPRIEA